MQIDETQTSSLVNAPTRIGKQSRNPSGASDRVLAERSQIYERLSVSSHLNVERTNAIFARFAIPLKEKKKKAALTDALCKSSESFRAFLF